MFVKKFEGGDFLILLNQGSKSDLLNEGLGSGETDTGDAHHLGPVEEAVVAVTRKVCDKGASTVQHVES